MRRASRLIKSGHRAAVNLSGSVRFRDGARLPVTVTSLSQNGCKLQAAGLLPIGAVVDLDIPGHQLVSASIGWSTLSTAGLRFI
jgi:hypothetical protein